MALENNYTITCIVGAPGSGKSATAQYIILDCIKKHKKVWSNMSFYGAFKLDLDDLGKVNFTNENEEGVFIIDEAGISFNSRQWEKLSSNVIEFLKYHRHYRLDIYFFSQGDDIDKSIRTLSQQWYKVIPLKIPIFHRYSALIPVDVSLNIVNGQWKLEYLAQKSIFNWKFIPIYKTFSFYNSYNRPNLPLKDFEKWDVEVHVNSNTFLKRIDKQMKKILYYLKNKLNKILFKIFRLKKSKEKIIDDLKWGNMIK